MVNLNKDNNVDNLIDDFTVQNQELINLVRRGIEKPKKLKDMLYKFIASNNYKADEKELSKVYEELKRSIWGYGILQPLIDDDSISDIKPTSINTVRIKQYGTRKTSNIKFSSEEKLKKYIEKIATRNGVSINEINAIQRFTDKTQKRCILRIDISGDYINSVDYPYMHIRKIPKQKYLLDDLLNKNMFNKEIKNYFITAMQNDLGILICGKGGSGKTYLFNALIEEIPHYRAGLFVQEAEELFSNTHPDLMFQVIRTAKGEGNVEYTLADLIKNGLVADVDYIGVGEIKGAEAWDLVNAAYTGHIPMASLHTINSKEAPYKILHYMKYSKNAQGIKDEDLLRTLVGFDTIIFMKDFKTAEITEIAGFENGQLIFNPVFEYDISKNKFIKLNDSCSKVLDKINYNKFKNKLAANM